MVRLVKIVIVLGLLWSAYWYGAGYLIRRNLTNWFDNQIERGWQADIAEMSTSGYPLDHVTTLSSPALADPGTGIAWSADWLDIASPVLQPASQSLVFPDTAQRLSHLDQSVTLTAQDMRIDLVLHPGKDMQLEKLSLTSGPWETTDTDGPVMRAEDLVATLQQGDNPASYQLTLGADSFTPAQRMRRLIGLTGDNESFEKLSLDMTVTFDRPWDRQALELRRPQPVLIDLQLAEIQWGALRLMMAGSVTVNDGVPTGNITVKAENWQEMLDMAESAGMLPGPVAGPIRTTLQLLSRAGGNRSALDVELELRDGKVYLGPLPIAAAPMLILR